jgi:lipid-binding SYLF domain-containing protein
MHKIVAILIGLILVSNCDAGWHPFKKKYKRSGEENARLLIQKLRDFDPSLNALINSSVGYAVFPRIANVAIGIGGGGGNGKFFYGENLYGTCKLTQVSFGLQLGGQIYSEVVLFQDVDTFQIFLSGEFKFGGSVSLAILEEGWGRNIGFKDGTAVIVKGQKGLMYEAAIKGQRFHCKPIGKSQ